MKGFAYFKVDEKDVDHITSALYGYSVVLNVYEVLDCPGGYNLMAEVDGEEGMLDDFYAKISIASMVKESKLSRALRRQ